MSAAGLMDLKAIAQKNLGTIHLNLTSPRLVEETIRNRNGHLAHQGPLVVRTAHLADCGPADRYLVSDDSACPVPHLSSQQFEQLFERMLFYAQNRDVYVQDCLVGADPEYRLPIRIVTETAWHCLCARNLFHQIHSKETMARFEPDWTVVHIPGFLAVPERDGTRSSAFVLAHPEARLVLVGGAGYAGEIRQAVSLITAALDPRPEVLPLRCSVNIGPRGDVAAFVGRTGNGKTALATDPTRRFIGDHEHGWSNKGLFSYQWGCYAKVHGLDAGDEPLIHACTRKFGTVLENSGLDHQSRLIQLDQNCLTDNLRGCFPISHLDGAETSGLCGHPANIFMLTRDNTGVLPPIARLDGDQAVFAFLTSYTSSLYETEDHPGDVVLRLSELGDQKAVLGGLAPDVYAGRFMKMIESQGVRCWFVNTGWVGEPRGNTERIPLSITRALVRAAVDGQLDGVDYQEDPLFGFQVPQACPGVDPGWLNPRKRAQDEGEYELRANQLAAAFISGFRRFGDTMPASVQRMVASVVLSEDTLDVMESFKLSF